MSRRRILDLVVKSALSDSFDEIKSIVGEATEVDNPFTEKFKSEKVELPIRDFVLSKRIMEKYKPVFSVNKNKFGVLVTSDFKENKITINQLNFLKAIALYRLNATEPIELSLNAVLDSINNLYTGDKISYALTSFDKYVIKEFVERYKAYGIQ